MQKSPQRTEPMSSLGQKITFNSYIPCMKYIIISAYSSIICSSRHLGYGATIVSSIELAIRVMSPQI